jgi:hypothetical protein
MTGVIAGISYFAITTAKSVQENAEFAKSIDLSYEAMQKYQYAIGATGGNAEAARNDLDLLAQRAKRTGQTLEQTAQEMAGQFDGLGEMESSKLGGQLGFSEDTIRLLRKGKDGVAALFAEGQKQGAIIPGDAPEKAIQFNAAMHSLEATMSGIKSNAVVMMLPVITKILEVMKKWVGTNNQMLQSGLKDFIEGVTTGFTEFAGVVGDVITVGKSMLESVVGMMGGMDKAAAVAKVVEYALAALAIVIGINLVTATYAWTIALLSNPFTWVVAGLIAMGLACYALYKWFRSLYESTASVRLIFDTLGGTAKNLWSTLKVLAEIIWAIAGPALNALLAPMKLVWNIMGDLWDLITGASTFSETFSKIGNDILKYLLTPLNMVLDIASNVIGLLSKIPGMGGMMKGASEAIKDIQKKGNNPLGVNEAEKKKGKKLESLDYLSAPIVRPGSNQVSPAGGPINNNTQQSSNVTNNINVNAGGAGAKEVGRDLSARLGSPAVNGSRVPFGAN